MKSDNIFLATTALEEFWDTSNQILFLGDWCLLYGRRRYWEKLNYKILDTKLHDIKSGVAFYNYVNLLFEKILPILADAMNVLHGTKHGIRYWRILLGPWLLYYLPAVYDRYIHLAYALERYPDLATRVLSRNSFVTAFDTLEYSCLLKEDSYNLQIYSKLLIAFGLNYPSKEKEICKPSAFDVLANRTWKYKISSHLVKMLKTYAERRNNVVYIKNSYFPKKTEIALFLKTHARAFPLYVHSKTQKDTTLAPELRKHLANINLGDGEFEKYLVSMLYTDIPMCFVEGYLDIKKDMELNYPKKPKYIFSANAWYCHERFKQWAATAAEGGAKLIGAAHGGNYGGHAYMPAVDYETTIVDRYYSWGWQDTKRNTKIIPFESAKLVGRPKIGASNKKNGILWVTTYIPRYVQTNEVVCLPSFSNLYVSWQSRFIKCLNTQILSELRLRAHREDEGWGIVERLKEHVPDLQVESWNVPFANSLENCRLYVCDHLSTTFVEALYADIPTILFWNSDTNVLREEAEPFYDLLRKHGILYSSPEEAGEAVNKIYFNSEAWWTDFDKQKAVQEFCKQFARNSPNSIDLWAAELRRISSDS